jgi:peptide/nickel transport system substrate-binding protein
VSEALTALRVTSELPERQRLVEEAMTVINENVPMTYGGNTLSVVAAHDQVKNLDGWTFPDGEPGGTAAQGTVSWGEAWSTG